MLIVLENMNASQGSAGAQICNLGRQFFLRSLSGNGLQPRRHVSGDRFVVVGDCEIGVGKKSCYVFRRFFRDGDVEFPDFGAVVVVD